MKNFFLLLTIIIFSFNTNASHLMGGEITWTCIKSGSNAGYYVFEVKVYRDCQGIPISYTMPLTTHNIPGMTSINLNWISGIDISPTCDTINGVNDPFSCGGNNVGYAGNGNGAVEEHIYRSDTIRLLGTPDSLGWHFSWRSCCRNSAITNLDISSGPANFELRASMYSYTDSTGTVFPNNNNCYDSSPKFYEKPRTILEVGNGYDPTAFSNGFTYSHNAFDEEQDSIAYSFAEPIALFDYTNTTPPSPGASTFIAPYSYTMPINNIVMNSVTGRTFYPANLQGNYVTCTKVAAYKCGQIVSEIFREIQVVLVPPTCNLGDTTNGKLGADTLCNVRPIVQPPFFYPGTPAPFQWDTAVHCGDTVSFEFVANDYDFYPNGARQDLKFEVSGGQFYDYNNNTPCQNPPCATFEEISTGATPPFITSGGTGTGYFEWITSCNHLLNSCAGSTKPSVYTFVIKVQDDFCPAPAIENTSQVISITVYPPCGNIKANEFVTDASQCGSSDGSIIINPSGGFGPYTSYFFDMNGIPVNPSNLPAGDYQIRITDVSLCELVDTISVSGPSLFTTSLTSINPSCFAGNNGTISTLTNGGTPPFTYLWNNGDTTQTLFGLTAGQYNVVITDANNCTQYDTVNLIQPSEITNDSALTIINNVDCNGNSSGSINIAPAGGTLPYSFIWSNGATSEDLNNISAGTYSVNILDSFSCSSVSYTYTVTEPSALVISSTTNSVSCNGLSDGSIDAFVSGGVAGYNYVWSNGDTTEDITGLSSGIYTLQVYDMNSCVILDSIIVTEPAILQASLSTNNTTLTSLATGGTTPYDYQIVGPSGFMASSLGNAGVSFTTSPLTSGTYTFTVIDANGCSDSVDLFFTLDTSFTPSVNVSISNLVCNNLSDLTIEVSQDSGEVDMSTGLIVSNAGSFDIASMNLGDTIGTAYLMAGGGSIMINTMIMVSFISPTNNSAIIVACDSLSGCIGSFTITNTVGGGIDILTSTVPDGNNYTQGNMSSITFENCFINPCGSLIFSTTINSELGDVDNQSFTFLLTSLDNQIQDFYNIYPNPSNGNVTVDLYSQAKDVTIKVTDILGKKIYYHNNFQNYSKQNINLTNLSKGSYIINVMTETKNLSKVIIID